MSLDLQGLRAETPGVFSRIRHRNHPTAPRGQLELPESYKKVSFTPET
jgi:hypothetical protein